jgi:hypothetical protein
VRELKGGHKARQLIKRQGELDETRKEVFNSSIMFLTFYSVISNKI